MIITFLKEPTEASNGQLAAYQALTSLGRGTHSLDTLRDMLGLRSILPVRSRLRHLAEKGIIAIN